MTKDVLISISGLHFELTDAGGEAEPIEVITPASYYFKNGRHYVIYDEVVEGLPGKIKNTIKITDDRLFEIRKTGLTDTCMVFEKDHIHMSSYQTPFGSIVLGIRTKDMNVEVRENDMDVRIFYELDVNHEPLSNCRMNVHIRGKDLQS